MVRKRDTLMSGHDVVINSDEDSDTDGDDDLDGLFKAFERDADLWEDADMDSVITYLKAL